MVKLENFCLFIFPQFWFLWKRQGEKLVRPCFKVLTPFHFFNCFNFIILYLFQIGKVLQGLEGWASVLWLSSWDDSRKLANSSGKSRAVSPSFTKIQPATRGVTGVVAHCSDPDQDSSQPRWESIPRLPPLLCPKRTQNQGPLQLCLWLRLSVSA